MSNIVYIIETPTFSHRNEHVGFRPDLNYVFKKFESAQKTLEWMIWNMIVFREAVTNKNDRHGHTYPPGSIMPRIRKVELQDEKPTY